MDICAINKYRGKHKFKEIMKRIGVVYKTVGISSSQGFTSPALRSGHKSSDSTYWSCWKELTWDKANHTVLACPKNYLLLISLDMSKVFLGDFLTDFIFYFKCSHLSLPYHIINIYLWQSQIINSWKFSFAKAIIFSIIIT